MPQVRPCAPKQGHTPKGAGNATAPGDFQPQAGCEPKDAQDATVTNRFCRAEHPPTEKIPAQLLAPHLYISGATHWLIGNLY